MTEYLRLSDLPPDVLATLQAVTKYQDDEDITVERAIICAMREARLKTRIPKLVETLINHHPGLSTIAAIRIAALKLGVSTGHCRNIYYGLNL